MTRRTIVATLWFVSMAFGGEIAWSLGVTPRPLGLIVAAAIAGFVWLDPVREFHPRADVDTKSAVKALPIEAQLLPR